VTWRSLVEEFLDAQAALRMGDHQPLKAFINESLGEPWEDRLKEFTDYGFLEQVKRPYALGVPWAFEKIRFLSIDVQKDHYRYVCRAFGMEGGNLVSRLIEYGRINTELEIEEARDRLNVTSRNVMMDSGHEAPRIYRMCAKYGWKAFKGTDQSYFPAVDPTSGKRIRRLWSVSHADPAMGTAMQGRVKPVKLFLTAKPAIQDMLAEWMLGMGIEWSLPEDVGEDYLKEVTASKRVERTDAKGRVSYVWVQTRRDNHYEDCEHQIVVAALASGLVKFAAKTTSAADMPDAEGTDMADVAEVGA
jgi:phage terminase large subunit GpA-like protein